MTVGYFYDGCFVHCIAIPYTSENTKHGVIRNTQTTTHSKIIRKKDLPLNV